MDTGTIVDIQRFSLHDGPGIRTSVFLKGCPLRCTWCHNPESQATAPQLSYLAARCTFCRACEQVCPRGVHAIADDRHTIDRRHCTACGLCVDACPEDALHIVGRQTSVSEVMDLVERDRAYYAASGGGMTISGGEPLAQAAFAAALLRTARRREIHTCVETSGAGSRAAVRQLGVLADLVLFDYKVTDARSLLQFTGASPGGIGASLRELDSIDARVILRCPMIPGVNDTDEHLKGIARAASEHPSVTAVEILPYHRLGAGKAERVGRLPQPEYCEPQREELDAWIARLRELGCVAARGDELKSR